MAENTDGPVGRSLLLALARKATRSHRLHNSRPNRADLIKDYGRLVHKIASRYKKTGILYEDLYQTGIVGLLEAYNDFKEDKGCQFSTYAHWHINSRIRLLCRKNRRINEFEVVDIVSSRIDEDVVMSVDAMLDTSGMDAESVIQAKEICAGIERIFNNVRDEEKIAIIVGLGIVPRKQAAEEYGCSVTAISNWKAAVFKKLAKEVDSHWPIEAT